jgi:uncharacterized membrane protein YbhN (UPF0104 family)
VRLVLKLALPVVVVAVVLFGMREVGLSGVVAKMRSATPLALALVVGLSLVKIALGAFRLWFVFPRVRRPALVGVARAFSFGELMNTYVPGRVGDAFKVASIARAHEARDGRSIAETTGALIAERGLDVASLALLAAIFGGGALLTVASGMVHRLWIVGAVALGVGVVFAAVRRVWPNAAGVLARVFSSTLSAMRGAVSAHRLSAIVAMALVGWIAELVSLSVLASALGFHLAFPQAVVAVVVLNLGIAVPVSVANVGAFEAALAVGLSHFGVPTPDAVAIGTVLHAAQIGAVILAALAFWLRDRWIRYRGGRRAETVEVCSLSRGGGDGDREPSGSALG